MEIDNDDAKIVKLQYKWNRLGELPGNLVLNVPSPRFIVVLKKIAFSEDNGFDNALSGRPAKEGSHGMIISRSRAFNGNQAAQGKKSN